MSSAAKPSNTPQTHSVSIEDAHAGQLVYSISGMTCSACVARLEKVISRKKYIASVQVSLATETAQIALTKDAPRNARTELIDVIAGAGYSGFELRRSQDRISAQKRQARELKLQSIEAAVAVLLSLPLMAPMLAGFSSDGSIDGMHMPRMPWMPIGLEATLASFVVLVSGRKILKSAASAIQNLTGSMDVLVALGSLSALALSFANWARGQHALLYFESAAWVVAFVLIGKALEVRARRQTTGALDQLSMLAPERVRTPSGWIALDQIERGTQILLLAGDRVPVDGAIAQGSADFNEAWLTGESQAVSKSVSDLVLAGSLNLDGTVELIAGGSAQESRLSQVIRAVETSQDQKTKIQKRADRISQWFVPVVLVLGVLTFFGYLALGHSLDQALVTAISVWVISCPCALGLAVPTALVTAMGTAARNHLLIRDGDALENLKTARVWVFDKTGTLTLGRPKLVATEIFSNEGSAPLAHAPSLEQILALARALASQSTHPLSRALMESQGASSTADLLVTNAKTIPGSGVRGTIQGVEYFLGSPKACLDFGVAIPDHADNSRTPEQDSRSQSDLIDLTQKRPLARFSFEDELRPEAKSVIADLRSQGAEIVILSGDHEQAVKRLAQDLGISRIYWSQSPEQKTAVIESLKGDFGPVAMVGDGINDSIALSNADLSFSISTASDLAQSVAQMTAMDGTLAPIPSAIQLAQKTHRILVQNLFWVFFYNGIAIPVAMAGLLTPMIAGAAMAMSSLFVVSNSLRLRRI
jgi:Cu+-exporting ATPase